MQGPDLVNKLFHVLLRFRLHSYAIQADIESMYHQVRIPVSDRDALRFLWYENEKLSYYRMTSHLFGGIWCASSSTYALRRTIRDNPDSDTLIKDTVDNAFYVDDCLKSVTTEDAAVKIVSETPELLHKGGFNLTKFVLNKSDILNEISVESRAKEVQDFCPETQSKVLGIKWKIMPEVFFLWCQLVFWCQCHSPENVKYSCFNIWSTEAVESRDLIGKVVATGCYSYETELGWWGTRSH